jgi:dihydroorotase
MNPPLRSAADVEALRQGVSDGTIDCLATDHAPHSNEEKEMEFALAPFGIISLDCALGLYAKALIHSGLMDWPELLAKLTVNPANLIDPTLGRLQENAPGDIAIIDPNKRWTVNVNKFASKARNCPYHGWRLKGRPIATIVGGEIKFRQ